MDGWKYTAKCGRKESGFENLKTRFQDCNLSRKQENRNQPCFPAGNMERKKTIRSSEWMENNKDVSL
jgi:hypothetical protein